MRCAGEQGAWRDLEKIRNPVRARVALSVLAVGNAACIAGTALAAAVEVFSPQGMVKDVRQVAVRFSEPMVAFGDPRLPEPFAIDCEARGRGRWADTRNWIYDFESGLPAGLECRFMLREGLKSVAGNLVTGRRQYSFDTGGPSIRASLPMDGDTAIDADRFRARTRRFRNSSLDREARCLRDRERGRAHSGRRARRRSP